MNPEKKSPPKKVEITSWDYLLNQTIKKERGCAIKGAKVESLKNRKNKKSNCFVTVKE